MCLIGHDQEVFKHEQSSCILGLIRELVDFSKLTLQQINSVGEEKWLPQGMNIYEKLQSNSSI